MGVHDVTKQFFHFTIVSRMYTNPHQHVTRRQSEEKLFFSFSIWIAFAVYLLLGDSDTCILLIKQSEINAIPCS
jgi:hypothetical protein